ncbi:GNAT family N-acetyltransferase [Anaerosalibacter sp. Marseille-P3206]|uniref:GNAT family N-acetyltransferase n=1 Tax=Anaerosalibacter sp. Marseille-P3206 TaxID=1871005 RepID=UPI000987C8AA|nr:GNAT family N-acetyltransferase [Anaerosalibacter sp. Marseille-P3206]
MEFRLAVESDVDNIMDIIKQAQNYLKNQGIDQWQDNYPNYETIKNDIKNNNCYVLLKDNTIVGTVAAIFGEEITYKNIYNGEWLSDKEYVTIHRLAISSDYKGLGLSSIILNKIEELCISKNIYSIRVDTHEKNLSMQNFLRKAGFQYCGIIYLENDDKRIAFEKIIDKQ